MHYYRINKNREFLTLFRLAKHCNLHPKTNLESLSNSKSNSKLERMSTSYHLKIEIKIQSLEKKKLKINYRRLSTSRYPSSPPLPPCSIKMNSVVIFTEWTRPMGSTQFLWHWWTFAKESRKRVHLHVKWVPHFLVFI